ncbi:MAG: helix-turn-helix domain-containing protein [Gammaproteobacteria bacterium]
MAEQPTIGQVLREARETQGMSVEAAAARLRLMQRQIEAIEADDFEGLGRPVFARGFVRNYAKLLGVEPDPLLERMEGPQTEPMPVRRPEPPLPRSWLSSPWLMVLSLAGLMVVAVPVGLYWWLNQGEEELLHKVPLAVQVEPVELGAPAPGTAAPDALPPAAPQAPGAASPPPPADAPAPAVQTAPAAPPAEAAAPAAPVDASAGGVLHFDFADDSWVEIRDASGRTLHRQLNPAGSSIEVRGRPPFRLLVGNAAQARMTYNGRPIDLKPFIDVTVARFTLEE